MTRISPRAQQLLEHYRAARQLDAETCARMSRALTDRVARGETALPDIDASPIVLPEISLLGKLLGSGMMALGTAGLGVVVVAGAATALLWDRDGAAPAPAAIAAPPPAPPLEARPSAPARPAPQSAANTVVLRGRDPAAPVPAQPEATARAARTHAERIDNARAPRANRARATVASAAAQVSSPPTEAAPPQATPAPAAPAEAAAAEPTVASSARVRSDLDAELALLRRAYSELNAGRPAQAFDLLDEHAERFPRGELEEAREVARMLALCAMGREKAARVRADSFLAAHPHSPFVGRVRSMCPPPSPAPKPER